MRGEMATMTGGGKGDEAEGGGWEGNTLKDSRAGTCECSLHHSGTMHSDYVYAIVGSHCCLASGTNWKEF